MKGELVREEVEGKAKQERIDRLEEKLGKLVLCNQQQEVRFHEQIDHKNWEIRQILSQHKQ